MQTAERLKCCELWDVCRSQARLVPTLQVTVIQEVLVRLPPLSGPGEPVHGPQGNLPPSPYHLKTCSQKCHRFQGTVLTKSRAFLFERSTRVWLIKKTEPWNSPTKWWWWWWWRAVNEPSGSVIVDLLSWHNFNNSIQGNVGLDKVVTLFVFCLCNLELFDCCFYSFSTFHYSFSRFQLVVMMFTTLNC